MLVVDDNAETRALAQATLEDEGFAVRLAWIEDAAPGAIFCIRIPHG